MQIIGHGSLYTYPQNLYPLNFSNFFTNLTEKLGYHSNEIGKKWIFPFTKEWYCMGNNWTYAKFQEIIFHIFKVIVIFLLYFVFMLPFRCHICIYKHYIQKSCIWPSNEHFCQVWFKSVLWFQKKRWKCEIPIG
jgi:hypothetical protein